MVIHKDMSVSAYKMVRWLCDVLKLNVILAWNVAFAQYISSEFDFWSLEYGIEVLIVWTAEMFMGILIRGDLSMFIFICMF